MPVGSEALVPSGGGDAESDDLLAELSKLEPQEPCSPRNLDELIPDAAAAARHDGTAVLLGATAQQAPPYPHQGLQ
jgi:hypothetical protein